MRSGDDVQKIGTIIIRKNISIGILTLSEYYTYVVGQNVLQCVNVDHFCVVLVWNTVSLPEGTSKESDSSHAVRLQKKN